MLQKADLKELKTLIALCKKEGLKSIELNGIKIEFNPYTPIKKTRKKKSESEEPIVEEQYTDEDILFWSA